MSSGDNGNAGAQSKKKKAVRRRALTFKVMDEERKAIVSVPFETAASDIEIDEYVRGSIERIKELRPIIEAHPAIKKLHSGRGVRHLTIYVHDSLTNTSHQSFTIVEPISRHMMDAESYAAKLCDKGESVMSTPTVLRQIYEVMAEHLRKKRWNIEEIKSAQWREVCALHPLYLSGIWDESRKRHFEKVSKKSIKAGAKAGRFKIPGVAT